MIDVLPVLFAISILYFTRKTDSDTDCLSVAQTTNIRGLMAVAIVMHHLSEQTKGGFLMPTLVHVGYLIVGVFLFFSGYGLLKQYENKGERYLNSFWLNRIIPLAADYFIITIVYVVGKLILGYQITLSGVLGSFVNGSPVATNSWYIIVQLLLYILFYSCFRFCAEEYQAIWGCFWGTVLLVAFFRKLGYSSIWYISLFPFCTGQLYAHHEEKIKTYLSENWTKCFVCVLLLFIFFSELPLLLSKMIGGIGFFRQLCRMLSTTVFAVLATLVMYKIRISGEFWRRLGSVSLEIYMIHGLVMLFFKSMPHFHENELLYALGVILVSIVVAFPLNALFRLLNLRIRSLNQKLQ